MTKTSISKRITAVVLCAVMMFSAMAVIGSVSTSALSSNDVQLYSCNPYFAKYGMCTFNIYLTTTGNSSDEQVYIHYNYYDKGYRGEKTWFDKEASFVKDLGNGKKLWKAQVTSFDLKYAIKYVCNGVTVWNNNNGNDFTYENVIGANTPIEVHAIGGLFYGSYKIETVLQNYAYHKNVFVRYTTDNWQSYTDAALSYNSTNSDGTETWSTALNLTMDGANNIEYAVCYQANGQTYWANNFGENYDASYTIHS